MSQLLSSPAVRNGAAKTPLSESIREDSPVLRDFLDLAAQIGTLEDQLAQLEKRLDPICLNKDHTTGAMVEKAPDTPRSSVAREIFDQRKRLTEMTYGVQRILDTLEI